MRNNESGPKGEDRPLTWGDVGVNEAGALEEDIGMWDDVELTPEQAAQYREQMEDDCPYE